MKNYFLVLLAILTFTVNVSAQDDGDKLSKKAKKSLTTYLLDNSDKSKLSEAKELIDKAFATGALENNSEAWVTKGDIYVQLAQDDANMKIVNPDAKSKYPDAPAAAFDAFQKSINYAEKESGKKDGYTGLSEVIGLLSSTGLEAYYARDFAKAYDDFNKVLLAHDIISGTKVESPIKNAEDLNNQYLITGLAALNNGDDENAGKNFEKAFNGGLKSADIYDGLFRSYSKTNPEKAEKYLAEGRAAFPEDNNLLFSEINLFLSQGKLKALLDKLELAKTKEPDNVSVINTLGNVYDKLYQSSTESGDTDMAKEYFAKSEENYKLALSKDPGNNFANYSMGTLYYNQAAGTIKEMQKVADDMSKAGIAKYNALEQEVFSLFDKALPYFETAEKSDPNDMNTLIALKEIYARKNNLEKSNEYKAKMEKMK